MAPRALPATRARLDWLVCRVREEFLVLTEPREAAVTWDPPDLREVPGSRESEDSRESRDPPDPRERPAVLETPGLLELWERPEPQG